MKTYQFDEALNAINETNKEHIDILYFYQNIKTELCQDKLSDTRILELFEISQKDYFDSISQLISCLSEFNNHLITDIEAINIQEFEDYAKGWSPYKKISVDFED